MFLERVAQALEAWARDLRYLATPLQMRKPALLRLASEESCMEWTGDDPRIVEVLKLKDLQEEKT